MLTIGVDVGGTKISGAVVQPDGTLVLSAKRHSPATDPAAIRGAIADVVEELSAQHRVEGVGIAAAGFIDKDRSTVLFAPNLAWRDEPLRQELEDRLKLPVVVENDANAAAWGEFRFGAGVDAEDLLLVTVGTGVGGGMVLEGELMRGGYGIAAEVGHISMVPGGRVCGCGNHGCLEAYASGSALVRGTREEVRSGSLLARGLLDRAGDDVEAIDGPMITTAAQAGDAFAIDRLAELGHWLGMGIATLAAVLDPTVVVIGGGVSEAGELLFEPVRTTFSGHLTGRGHRPMLEIRGAQLGNRAGMLGAADLVRRDLAGETVR